METKIFELMKLPYAADVLEPVISKETIGFHHGKHLTGYVNNLNNLMQGTDFQNLSLEEIVLKSDGGIRNNAGQILNHNLYFEQFAKDPKSAPTGKCAISARLTLSRMNSRKKGRRSSVLVGYGFRPTKTASW